MAIVDAHHHVWDLSVRHQPWLDQPDLAPLRRNFLLSDLEPEAAAEGVTSTVLVQTVTEPGETPEMLALAAGSDLIAGVVGWVDLEAPGAADALGALQALPGGDFLVGIRHPVLVEPDPDWLTRPAVLRGLADVAAAGLTYDVVLMPRHLRAAVAAAQATPQLTLVLDHFGNPEIGTEVDESWAGAFRAFAALPNTVAKLSGILGEPAPSRAGPADTDRASEQTAAGQHADGRIRRCPRRGPVPDRRPEPHGEDRDLSRHGAADLPARTTSLAILTRPGASRLRRLQRLRVSPDGPRRPS
jgi:L-fuconolactonase